MGWRRTACFKGHAPHLSGWRWDVAIEKNMTTPPPERRRLQFGLRKLLLWTTVVAVFLGIFKMLGIPRGVTAAMTCWFGILIVLREVASRKAVLWLSVSVAVVGYVLAFVFGGVPPWVNPNTVQLAITTASAKVFVNGGGWRCWGRFLGHLDTFCLMTRGLMRLRRGAMRSWPSSHRSDSHHS